MSRPPLSTPPLLAAGALIAAGIVGVALGLSVFGPHRSGGGAAAVSGTLEGSGTALIGGPFELQHVDRGLVSEAILDQPVNFVYFGFTNCPDFCPMELTNLAAARAALSERGLSSKTVFITVDPERDTTEVAQEYAAFFDPEAIGLSGSAEQVADAMATYRVYAQATEKDETGYYAVDHSTFVYAMDSDGALIKFFSANTPPETIATEIAARLEGRS